MCRRRLIALTAWLGLGAAPVCAQVVTPVGPTSIDVLILAPGTSDPTTAVPVATRNTLIAAGGAMCGQAALTTVVTTNPTIAEIDDPFVGGGLKCRLAIPIGLANGVGYRAVVVANGSCSGVPCSSARSPVGVPTFPISGTPAPPAVPTTLVVKP